MTRRLLVGIFNHEDDVLQATRASRARGLKIVDVYAPYAVHGLDHAMGLPPATTLPWVCFLLGLFGAGFKVWFEYWATAVDWPMNIGGKPWNSLPAFVPLTFEVMVLFAGVSTVVAFFMVTRLRPGGRALMPDPHVTDDRFVLILEETDAAFDVSAVQALFEQHHAVRVEERIEREA
jgi:hypothetical protein